MRPAAVQVSAETYKTLPHLPRDGSSQGNQVKITSQNITAFFPGKFSPSEDRKHPDLAAQLLLARRC